MRLVFLAPDADFRQFREPVRGDPTRDRADAGGALACSISRGGCVWFFWPPTRIFGDFVSPCAGTPRGIAWMRAGALACSIVCGGCVWFFWPPTLIFGDFASPCAGTPRGIARMRRWVVGWREGVVNRLIPVARRISDVKDGPRRATFFSSDEKKRVLDPRNPPCSDCVGVPAHGDVDAPERKWLGRRRLPRE